MIKTKKILCVLMSLICVLALTSCKAKLKNAYDFNTRRAFLYEENKIRNATPFSYKLFIPSVDTSELAQNVTVDSYLLASENGDASAIHKYKNAYTKRSIASLTKIITFLTVINECDDLEREVVVSANSVNLGEHSSMAGLKRGDTVKIIDLLYGLMLPSGNDCAVALAENVGNSVSDFVVLMNRYAEKLGCVHSHFTNPHGLDDEFHYSTAFDIYLFLREANKSELFRKIVGTNEYTITVRDEVGNNRDILLKQTNKYITGEVIPNDNILVIGGKTGSTEKAGKCLAIISKNKTNNEEFYSIVLYSSTDQTVYRNMQGLLSCIV